MTKKQYIDWMINNLSQLDQTGRYHPLQVEYAIEQSFDRVFYEIAEKSPKSLERYSIQLTGVASSLDSNTGRYTSTLTKKYTDLPLKASGILEVRLPTTTTLAFVPMTSIEMDQAYSADLTLGATIIGFSVHSSKIEFFGMSATSAVLTIRMIQKFSEYASTDEVLPPYGKDYDITGMVMAVLSNIPPKDLTNDNSDISYGESK